MGEGESPEEKKRKEESSKGKTMEKEGKEEELAPKLQTGTSNQYRTGRVFSSKFHEVLAWDWKENGMETSRGGNLWKPDDDVG